MGNRGERPRPALGAALVAIGLIGIVLTCELAHAHSSSGLECEAYLTKEEAPFPDFSAEKWEVFKVRERAGTPTLTFYRDTTRSELPVAGMVSHGTRTDVAGETITRTRVSWWHTHPDGSVTIRTARREVEEMVCERPAAGIAPRVGQ